jgi:hypothetical protein
MSQNRWAEVGTVAWRGRRWQQKSNKLIRSAKNGAIGQERRRRPVDDRRYPNRGAAR